MLLRSDRSLRILQLEKGYLHSKLFEYGYLIISVQIIIEYFSDTEDLFLLLMCQRNRVMVSFSVD